MEHELQDDIHDIEELSALDADTDTDDAEGFWDADEDRLQEMENAEEEIDPDDEE